MEVGKPHLVLCPGKSESLDFRLLQDTSPLSGAEASVKILWPDKKLSTEVVKSDSSGVASFAVQVPEAMTSGAVQITISPVLGGKDGLVSGEILSREEYARADALAASIKLEKPQRILYLGDSLTAQMAGSNHVDKLHFWLEKYNPGMAAFRNAAVGGDNIRIVSRRLRYLESPSAGAPQFRQETYDALFDFKPTLVFIALGQNDTKVTSRSNYMETHLTPEQWASGFQETLDAIAKNSDAQVVLLSSISPVEEICRRRAEAHVTTGKEHLLFGKPEAMQAFNTFLKNLAEKRGLAFVDVYEPTRAFADKASLFKAEDGVHLTVAGSQFMSLQYLQYFARRFPRQSEGPGL